MNPTPGWKTSEFWMSVAAQALGAVAMSGLPADSPVVQVSGLALSALSALGYGHSRATVKKAQSMSQLFEAKPVQK